MAASEMVSYEWRFSSEKNFFEFFVEVKEPVSERGYIYVVEAVGRTGVVQPEVQFDWFHSKTLSRWFVYSRPAVQPAVHALRPVGAESPLVGVRLTIRSWDTPDPAGAYGECWLRTEASGSQAKSRAWALGKGMRRIEEDVR